MMARFDAESLANLSARLEHELSTPARPSAASPHSLAIQEHGSCWPRLHRPRHSRLSPRLSYGRHRGPARKDSRRAAVIIAVYPHRQTGELCLTLTRRPTTLSHHGGQICLPGGRIEPDESPLDAALREYHEELGLAIDLVAVAGRLSPIYVYASDNLVETFVVTAKTPSQDWKPDPVEVDEVIEMPLASLLSLSDGGSNLRSGNGVPANRPLKSSPTQPARGDVIVEHRTKVRRGKTLCGGEDFQFAFGYQALKFTDCNARQCELWGATAILLDEFAAVIARLSS